VRKSKNSPLFTDTIQIGATPAQLERLQSLVGSTLLAASLWGQSIAGEIDPDTLEPPGQESHVDFDLYFPRHVQLALFLTQLFVVGGETETPIIGLEALGRQIDDLMDGQFILSEISDQDHFLCLFFQEKEPQSESKEIWFLAEGWALTSWHELPSDLDLDEMDER